MTLASSIQSSLCCAANFKILNLIKIDEIGKGPFLQFIDLFLKRIVNKFNHRDSEKFIKYAQDLICASYPEEVHFEVAQLFAIHIPRLLLTNWKQFKLSDKERLQVLKTVVAKILEIDELFSHIMDDNEKGSDENF